MKLLKLRVSDYSGSPFEGCIEIGEFYIYELRIFEGFDGKKRILLKEGEIIEGIGWNDNCGYI